MTRSMLGLLLGSAFVLISFGNVHAHGGDPTKIHACVNKSSGEIKIVAPNATCKPNENAVDWAAGAAAAQRILTEISLVSNLPGFNNGTGGIVSRFRWEPDRYDPAPSEMFFEVVAGVFEASGSATFRLHDATNNVDLASLTVNAGNSGRFRTADIAAAFPATAAEIQLVVDLTATSFSIQRSAVLVQQ